MPCEMLYSTDTHLQGTNALQPTQWDWIYLTLLDQGHPPLQATIQGNFGSLQNLVAHPIDSTVGVTKSLKKHCKISAFLQ